MEYDKTELEAAIKKVRNEAWWRNQADFMNGVVNYVRRGIELPIVLDFVKNLYASTTLNSSLSQASMPLLLPDRPFNGTAGMM